MTNSTQPRQKDTRLSILSQAESLFARQGFGGTTLDQIASAVNIKRPSLIYYFSGKKELYEAMLEQLFSRQSIFFRIDDEGLNPNERLHLLVDRWLDYALKEPNYLRIFLQNLAIGYQADGLFWKSARPIVRLWESTLSEGRRQGLFAKVDLIHFLSIVGGMTAYYILLRGDDGQIDIESESWKSFCAQIHGSVNAITLI